MSNRLVVPSLRRRSMLQLLLSTGLGLGLSACADGSDVDPQDETEALLKTQAEAAVAAGLVGVSMGFATSQGRTSVVSGKRRSGLPAPAMSSDPFAIGSNTKAMTSAAIVALAERGGPALSSTLPQAFADWAGDIHPGFAGVTLADLLHHRGAIPAFNGTGPEEDAFLAFVAADTRPLPDTMMGRRAYFARWVLSQPPVDGVTPGRDFHYSNAGYAVAAAIVETLTARTFEAVFDEVLVRPLGLSGHWRSPVPGPQDELWGHEGLPGGLTVVEATADSLATKDWQDAMGPAGHWACSGSAYAQWLQWHVAALRGGRTPLPQVYVNDLRAASDNRYVSGWQSFTTPTRVLLMHTGHVAGFMSEVAMDHAGEFALFGTSNTGYFAADGTSWVLQCIDSALAEVLKRKAIVL